MLINLKDGSGSMKLRHLMKDVDRHGKTRIYFRRKGHSKTCLKAEIGTPEFLEEYRRAFDRTIPREPAIQRKPVAANSLRWLVTEYYSRAAAYKRLDEHTKGNYRRRLDPIVERAGDRKIAALEAKHIEELRDEKSDTPNAANTMLKALRSLFKWAKKQKYVAHNPTLEVQRLEVFGDGHHTWTMEECLQFIAKHPAGTKAGLAFALLYYLGPRRSDVVKLGRQMETRDGGIRWTETKGSRRKPKITERAIEPGLRSILDMHKDNHLTYLVTEYGAPFSVAGFGAKMRKWCDEAGLKHCTAHGVRKGGATEAANNGASEHQLMAMYGWSNPKEAEVYTRRANRKKLARDGGKLLKLADHK